MVLLLTDVFLLLTQILLWIIVGTVIWFFLSKILSQQFLGLLVLLLFLAVIVLAFLQGGISEPGSILEIIWRVLSFPLTPFGLGLILLIALLTGRITTVLVRRIVYVVLLLILLLSIPIVSYWLAQELEMEAIELIAPAPQLDAGARQVIVLLGRNTTRPQLRPRREAVPQDPPRVERAITLNQYDVLSNLPTQLTEHGDNIIYAAQLYQEGLRQGTNPLIVVNAGIRPERRFKSGDTREEVSEARDIQIMLTQQFGIPAENILLENSRNVRYAAEQIERLLEERQINYGNQITLVDSALTMNRSALTFRQVFQESRIIARPTDFYTLPLATRLSPVVTGRDLVEREFLVTDLLPSAEAFCIGSEAIQEYLRSLYFFLRGWIRPFETPNLNRPVT